MALEISKVQKNGLETTYWRINSFQVDRELDTSWCKLIPYKDKDFRMANGISACDRASAINFRFNGEGYPTTIAEFYSKIKTMPQDPETGDVDWTSAIDQ